MPVIDLKPAEPEGDGGTAANRRLRLLRFLLPNYAAAYRIARSIASYIDESDPGGAPKRQAFETFMASLRTIDTEPAVTIASLASQHTKRPHDLVLLRKMANLKKNKKWLFQRVVTELGYYR